MHTVIIPIPFQVFINQTLIHLTLPTALALHLKRLKPPAPPLTASLPQPLDRVPTPSPPSNLPTSFPHAYPALKLMAENTSTTPALIIHVSSVASYADVGGNVDFGVALRVFLASGRSLLDERALRLEATERGEGGKCMCV